MNLRHGYAAPRTRLSLKNRKRCPSICIGVVWTTPREAAAACSPALPTEGLRPALGGTRSALGRKGGFRAS